MKKVTEADELFYFKRQFFTLDGLWIIETENATDLDTSLKIDLTVWQRLLEIGYRRIRRHLGIHDTDMDVAAIIDILSFRWSVEGWVYDIIEKKADRGRVKIMKCPYKEIMWRNPERRTVIPRICTEICIPIYDEAVRSMKPSVQLERTCFQGLGDESCDFEFSMDG